MSRLVDAAKLLDNLQKFRSAYGLSALDTASPENAAYEYGYKVGYNRGLAAAEQRLEELLKVEDRERKPEPEFRKGVHSY